MFTRQTLWLALPPIWRSLIVNSSRNGFGDYAIFDLDARHGWKLLVEDRNSQLWPPLPRNFIFFAIISPLSLPFSQFSGLSFLLLVDLDPLLLVHDELVQVGLVNLVKVVLNIPFRQAHQVLLDCLPLLPTSSRHSASRLLACRFNTLRRDLRRKILVVKKNIS